MKLPKLSSPYRVLQSSDYDLIRDFIIDSSKSRHDEFEMMDNEGIQEWMKGWLERVDNGQGVFYVVEHDGIIESWVSFTQASYSQNTLKLSFRFLRETVEFKSRRKALSELILSILQKDEWHRIESVCSADDQESRDLLVLCGFRLEGTIRQSLNLRSGWTDLSIYGILASDLPLENRL